MAASLHGDVASAIGQQVEQMILQAKKDSEQRVKHDLTVAKNQLQSMEAAVRDLTERVARCASGGGAQVDSSQTVDRQFLSHKIAQLEQKWGSEVKALKQDLHRTILAHNHNSDLMRHHRDALDEARRKLDAQTQPKAEQVDAQIEKVDRMLRQGQAKQRALDALTERLAVLEQQVNEFMPNPGMQGFPGMMPGIGGMPSMGQTHGGGKEPKRAAKKDEAGLPTHEEVRDRLMQAAQANKQAVEGSKSFNAEAPVFVPGAALASAARVEGATGGGKPAKAETGDDKPDAAETAEGEGAEAAAAEAATAADAGKEDASEDAEAK